MKPGMLGRSILILRLPSVRRPYEPDVVNPLPRIVQSRWYSILQPWRQRLLDQAVEEFRRFQVGGAARVDWVTVSESVATGTLKGSEALG